jgi:hypothetical protein
VILGSLTTSIMFGSLVLAGALLSVKAQAIISRWLGQEAATIAYHDMFVMTAILVVLAAVPVIWLKSRRVS